MAQSKHRPKFKANKKRNNIKKQKQKEMQNANQEKENPVTWAYHKDRETVEVPIKAWQMINQAANELQAIARFVSVTEQIGNLHQQDGTLLPVYKDDLEAIPGKFGPRGEQQFELKPSFWDKKPIVEIEKPTIVMADGKTVYDSSEQADKQPAIVTP